MSEGATRREIEREVDKVLALKAQTTEEKKSVRTLPSYKKGQGVVSTGFLTDVLRVGIGNENAEPSYWSQYRDAWLRKFLQRPGNDLLLGTISTIASRVATSKWFLEGPERTVNVYQKILSQRCGFNAGWTPDVTMGAIDFLTQDKGWTWERIRRGRADRRGGVIGLAHMDSASIEVWTDPEYPVRWYDEVFDPRTKKPSVQMHRSQVIRIIDLPSPNRNLRGVGLCGLSRAITTSQILASIAKYEKEKLSDLPPAGLLLLNNMSQKQFQDIKKKYDTRQENEGNTTWRDIMILFGLNPAVPLQAEFIHFSEMPEHFDKRTVTEIAMYSFALAFNTDPREIWPVSAGTLGTATEANIQHMKAKAKGHGLILALIERGINDGLTLPPTLEFKFDYQDVEEDERAARIQKLKAQTISILAGTYKEVGGATAIITQKQAQQWLIKEGIFTADELEVVEEDVLAQDTAEANTGEDTQGEGRTVEQAGDELPEKDKDIIEKSWRLDMGPKTRVWSDGRVQRLEIRKSAWTGHTLKSISKDGKVIVQGDPLSPMNTVPISPVDVARALEQFNKLMPEYDGMLGMPGQIPSDLS
jgi:hypothetical protein